MKKYKLKEEVKKYYVAADPNAVNTMAYWEKQHLLPEALEEVDTRTRVVMKMGNLIFVKGGVSIVPTEKQRYETELMLRAGGLDGLDQILKDWEEYGRESSGMTREEYIELEINNK